MFKSKADELSTIFAILSGVMFFGAVGSAIFLRTYGVYIALALVFFGGFSMLMSAMIIEKSKASMYEKRKASEIESDELEETLL